MKIETIIKNKMYPVLGAFLLTLAFILWEYFNGGVITHHLLASEDMPGMSNWWGLLTIPFLTWVSAIIIDKRETKRRKLHPDSKSFTKQILVRFLAALLFGLIAGMCWEFGFEGFLQYYMLSPILIAVFSPLYLSEYLVGFVIGMLYTFGGILPILLGIVLVILCFIVYKTIQFFKNLLFRNSKA